MITSAERVSSRSTLGDSGRLESEGAADASARCPWRFSGFFRISRSARPGYLCQRLRRLPVSDFGGRNASVQTMPSAIAMPLPGAA